MKLRNGAVLFAVSFACLSVGCSSATDQQAAIDTTAKGYQVFKANCAGCHGNQLQGVSGPNLSKAGSRLTKEQIENRILNGGMGMPAFKQQLDSQQVAELVGWLLNQK